METLLVRLHLNRTFIFVIEAYFFKCSHKSFFEVAGAESVLRNVISNSYIIWNYNELRQFNCCIHM